ncbi:MAG: HNH endonuclease [Actinomycetota bacterium]|nr:HNH endonuclease [Actinomycetota bacterium]
MPSPKHTREQLVVTTAFSWCMKDLLDKLGDSDTPRVRRNTWGRLRAPNVDTSHWDRSPKLWYSDQMLASAAARSISYASVLRELGVPVTGGQHAHLARRIRAAGIDTSHFLGQAHFRGTSQPRRMPDEILVVLPAGSGRLRTPTLRRALLRSGVPHVCDGCGTDPTWRGEPLILMIDHTNGDYRDNRRENLRFLCPNCHSQTSTWCRKTSARVKP